MSNQQKKSSKKDFSETIRSVLHGVIGALVVILFWVLWNPNARPVVTVNLTGIIQSYVHEVAKAHLPADMATRQVQTFASELELQVKKLSRQKGVIVLPREAVIAGAKDITPELLKNLPAFQKAKKLAESYQQTESSSIQGSAVQQPLLGNHLPTKGLLTQMIQGQNDETAIS